MAIFAWKGLKDGQYASGRIEGINRDEAAFKVKEQKVIITSLTRLSGAEQVEEKAPEPLKPGRRVGKKVPVKELVLFTKKLEAMMRAGLPILDTIILITAQIENKVMKSVIEQIKIDVESGTPLSDSFAKHPTVFDDIYVNLLKAGESSGKMDTFLGKLVEGIEKSQKIRSKIKSAMVYPTILLVVAVAVIAIMMIYVVPVFQEMFSGFAGGLPAVTQAVINISEFVRDPWRGGLLLGSVVGIIVMLTQMIKRSYKFRKRFHKFVLKLPLFGSLIQKSALAKLSMVQGNLSAAGVPVLESLDICASAMTNLIIKEATIEVKRGVFSGEPLSELYQKESKIFPTTFHAMVSVGEKTGNMEEMFGTISNYYEEEMDEVVDRLTAMLEPVMIVFMGTTIGFILLAMYTPMFMMGETL
ncbi:MAG: type II secretion system F family protein [Gammaproteobacteria bacterium]|jgi:type IV pilus assembly protein PilC|nr:type II secretion system F family protein [Acidiferrobacteraceae bacterium]MBT4403924.1 type II secretion system F family protein [Acidiferrobacteraceae bacterium]MBT5626603.1 type II secretion system F family protein [Pseudomonadota bacterium]MBT6667788.1 type II secretion system F family protein [Gammaproteobacteria bacterium]